jgi:inosine-uridine nucleoside N-ribohydrolase
VPETLPVIIDTDPGVDDALALMLAGASPELDVLALTTVGGNVPLDQATENACRIVPIAWEGRPCPRVFRGIAGPENHPTAEHVHGRDGLGGVTLLRDGDGHELYPRATVQAAEDAPSALVRLAAERPGEVVLITLGPLTNLARACVQAPDAVRGLRRVIAMGGAFREPGNTTPVAEFNVYVDPAAAQVVCDAGLPLTWVPLDLTHQCRLHRDDLSRLPPGARAEFAHRLSEFTFDFHHRGRGDYFCFLHDPAAVALAVWPELFRSTPLRVDVETHGRLTRGVTVADFRPDRDLVRQPPNAEVCLEVDAAELEARILRRFAG